jgi:hypothetical protein
MFPAVDAILILIPRENHLYLQDCSTSSRVVASGWRDLAIAAAYGAAAFVIGGLFFRHMKRGFADVL